MPRPRPPHLHRETNRHGTTVWYVRLGKESIRPSTTADRRDGRVARDVPGHIERIRGLIERFAPELATKGKANTASRQLKERGRINGSVDGGQL